MLAKALALSLTCAVAALPSTALAQGARKGATDAVERYLESCARFGWSGVALVAKNGKIVSHRGYGLADREAGVAPALDTVFEIASTTKPLTAVAVLALVEEGKVALDASIAEYLPNVPEDKRGITVRHLLSHTAGMARMGDGGGGDDLARAVAGYLSPALVRKPGAAHEYWNGGYALLAGIVDSVTTEGYCAYTAARVFARAGAESTGFAGETRWPVERQAVGYAADAPVRRAAEHAYGDSYDYKYRGMGGVVTTAEDLWRIARAVMAGKVLAPKTVTEMLTVVDRDYALGWGVTTTQRGTRRVSHGGDVRGFHAQLALFPDDGLEVVVLSNVDEVPLWHLSWNIEALMLGGEPPYPMPPTSMEVDDRALARYAGTYTLDGARVTVHVRDGALELEPDGYAARALLTGQARSRGAEETLATMVGLIEAVAKRDTKPFEGLLAKGIPDDWPTHIVEQYYPERHGDKGALQRVIALICSVKGPGHVDATFAVECERGTGHVRVEFVGGKLQIFDPTVAPPASRTTFVPCGKGSRDVTHFATFRWDPVPNPKATARELTLRLAPERGATKSLTLEGGGAAAVTLTRVD